MKKKTKSSIYLLAALTAAMTLGGCKKTSDYLRLEDRDGIDAQIWEQAGAVQFLLNETYDMSLPDFPYQYTANNFNIHLVSDENYFSANDSWGKKVFNFNGFLISNDPRFIASKQQGDNIGDNRYFDIGKSNLAIVNLPGSKTIPGDIKREMLGQFYALRALNYFQLTKYYGGVPLVLEPQNPNNLNLNGRVKAKVMFEQIVKDLDSAIVNLEGVTYDANTERGKLTKAAAAALKSRALLYWASPQFNPVNDGKHAYDPERWNTAHQAAKAAYEICKAAGHDLLPNYATLFQLEGKDNKEAIIIKSYSALQPKRGHGVEARSRPASESGQPSEVYYPSTRMVDAYTMKDGIPITASNSGYDAVLFWQNRDPRFAASIAFNGSTWKLSGKENRKQWTYINALADNGTNDGSQGLYVKRFSSPDLATGSVRQSGDYGGSGMDWIELRFAEVLLNYAETANETGDLALSKDLVRALRKRAGIVEGSQDYGLALAGNKDEMRDLILNERMVEFAFEGKRGDDLRRTRRMHLLSGQLGSLQFEPVSDAKKKELETIIDPAKGTRVRDTLNLSNKSSVQSFFKYPYKVVVPANNGVFSMPEYYYFLPFHNAFMNSSPLLEQTIGWDGGTFDPL
ncbi:RagB/SusD family nutrient uptake outer membrane protein [Paraflavisolibacter sp. H34]|uniref:RagB/SusD family nutrient uptake outer membrane protein n=1 Tax=Huijunlia imazamoxiresistens TaxID=3127457 RepID=UPI003018AA64